MNDFNNILSKELKTTNFSKLLINDDKNSKIKGIIAVECKQNSLPSLTICCITSNLTSSIWKLELSENIIINHFEIDLSIEVETGLKGYAQLFGKSLINGVSFGNLDNFKDSNNLDIKFSYNIGDPGIIQVPWLASELPSSVYEMMINIFNSSNERLQDKIIEEDGGAFDYIGQSSQDYQTNETYKEKKQLLEDQNDIKTTKKKFNKSESANLKKKKKSGVNII
jgi:hypothetical protein